MKRSNVTYLFLAGIVVLLTGFYAVDLKGNGATTSPLPDLKGTTHVTKSENRPASSLKDLNDAFVDIAHQTNPTVVTIRVKQTVKVKVPQDPFFQFFGDPRGGGTQERHRRGVGSGVIVSKDGYILTNNHVVADANEITVDMYNGKEYSGKVVGTDPLTDIAVVKIDADGPISAIQMGSSAKLRVGELVLAIGSPENLAHSVSMGIVSAKERQINLIHEGNTPGYENYIQTDAAINPGNSGGALVDMDGKLVGINAAIETKSGGNEGIGFAVPIDLARKVMKSIIKNGKVVHAQLGILGSDINSTLAQGLGLDNSKGVLVHSVQSNTAAERAGLKDGDVIKTLNGKPIDSYGDFRTTIATSQPGTKITLGIIRNGNHKTLDVTLGKSTQQKEASNQTSNEDMQKDLGFKVQKLTDRIAQQLDLDAGQQGVVVTNVVRGSKAYEHNLQRGDIITHVNKQPVKSVEDFDNILDGLSNKKNPVLLLQLVNRQGQNEFIAFRL